MVKGRKDYWCEYCNELIPKGTDHAIKKITPWCHRDNEGFDTWRIHRDCESAGDEFYYDDMTNGISPYNGNFSEFKEFRNAFLAKLKLNKEAIMEKIFNEIKNERERQNAMARK